MNNHTDIQKLLAAYCSHDLSETDHRMVERHLAECLLCRVHLTDLKTTLQLIHTTPEVEPPPWLTSRIMAHLREEQTAKRSWLQRIRFPQHTAFPAKIVALLVVCVSGYYLSRSVETGLQQSAQQQLQENTSQPAPIPPPAPADLPDGRDKQELPAAPQPTPATEKMPDQAPPQLQSTPAPRTYAPAPPADTGRYGGKAESMKAAPAAESSNRAQETAPEKMFQKSRRFEQSSDVAAPAPLVTDRAAGAPAAPGLPQATVRLSINDAANAPAMIREALLRSGGRIVADQGTPGQRLTARIPADRQSELMERLQQLGRITKRSATRQAGAQLVELTIQW